MQSLDDGTDIAADTQADQPAGMQSSATIDPQADANVDLLQLGTEAGTYTTLVAQDS